MRNQVCKNGSGIQDIAGAVDSRVIIALGYVALCSLQNGCLDSSVFILK